MYDENTIEELVVEEYAPVQVRIDSWREQQLGINPHHNKTLKRLGNLVPQSGGFENHCTIRIRFHTFDK